MTREGKGRATNSKTFHALRHTFISSMANAGVPPDIRQKLAGHADPRVHADYTHHEMKTLRGAVALRPSFRNAELNACRVRRSAGRTSDGDIALLTAFDEFSTMDYLHGDVADGEFRLRVITNTPASPAFSARLPGCMEARQPGEY